MSAARVSALPAALFFALAAWSAAALQESQATRIVAVDATAAGAGKALGLEVVEVTPDVFGVPIEVWKGNFTCRGAFNLSGEWRFEILNKTIHGYAQVLHPPLGKGKVFGRIDNGSVVAEYSLTVDRVESKGEWSGRVEGFSMGGSASFDVYGRNVACDWNGNKTETVKAVPAYGNFSTEISGSEIEIKYVSSCREKCKRIVLIQVVCRKAVFEDGTEAWFRPGDTNPDWKQKDSVTVNGGVDGAQKLCTVDYHVGERDPYVNGKDKQDSGERGTHAPTDKFAKWFAKFKDKPRYTLDSFNELKNRFGKFVKKIILEFETCALCDEDVGEAGKIYKCLKWRYEEEFGKRGRSTAEDQADEASQKFVEAVEKWNEYHKFKMPGGK